MTDRLPRAARRAAALTDRATPPDWYRVMAAAEPAAGPSSADVYVFGAIGGWLGMAADDFVRDVAGLDVDRIELHVNSPGGDVFEAVAMANVLRAHRAAVTVHVDGLAASAATVLAMAGDEIVMGVGSQMMVHDAWGVTVGNADEMLKAAEMLGSVSDSIASTYAARAGGSAADWRQVMRDEAWFSADEAVAAGLADRLAADTDRGSASGERVVPGGRAAASWDLWDSLSAQDRFDLSAFTYAGRAQAPTPPTPAARQASGSTPTTQEGSPPVFTDDQLATLRQQLGVSADADGTTVLAALNEALTEQADPAPRAALPDGVVPVDAGLLSQLQADAQAGREARAQQQREARDRLVNAAVQDGRIPPARREAWAALLDSDPGSADVLAGLAPGTVPVAAVGFDGNTGEVDEGAALAMEIEAAYPGLLVSREG